MEEIVQVQTIELPIKKQRAWEIDAIRGLLILLVVWDHFMFDAAALFVFNTSAGQALRSFARMYRASPLRLATHDTIVAIFVIVSGISTSFTRNNLKRGIKLGLFAIGLTLVLSLASYLKVLDEKITFGIIHMLACCVIISVLLNKIKLPKVAIGILALLCIVIGATYVVKPLVLTENTKWLFFLVDNNYASVMSPGDYWPLLPYLGWFLFGMLFGYKHYPERKSLVSCEISKYFKPISYIGRHTLFIYFASQVVMYGLLWLLVLVGF